MLRIVSYAFFMIVFAFCAAGCENKPEKEKDPIAMEDCSRTPSEQASADKCKTCCGNAGASGHSWSSENGCSCL